MSTIFFPFPDIPDRATLLTHPSSYFPTETDRDFVSPPQARLGCDFAGIVEEVAQGTTVDLKVGDRVAGFVHGGRWEDIGSFAGKLDPARVRITPLRYFSAID